MISKRIDEVIRLGLAPRLKADGYRKASRTFRKLGTEVVRLVNVQASQWNFGEQGKITLNLGAYAPELDRLIGSPVLPSPKVHECTVHTRIGKLTPEARDLWWEIDDRSDPTELAAEVERVFTEYGEPWLESVRSVRGIRDLLLQAGARSLEVAAAALLCGDRDQARTLLSRAMPAPGSAQTELRARARACVERWGLR